MDTDKPIKQQRNRKRPQPQIVQRKDRSYLEIQYYTAEGKRKFISSGCTDEKDALSVLADFLKQTEAARLQAVPSVSDCIKFYSEDKTSKYPITDRIKLIEYFGAMPATAITRTICRQYIAWRVKKGYVQHGTNKTKAIKPSTAWADLRALRACINFAETEGFCPKGEASFYVPAVPTGSRGVERYITKPQARQIIDACPTFYIRLYMLMALQSGHRQTAILSLPWDRVTRGHMLFPDPEVQQNNKRRGEVPVPRNSELFAMLSEARAVAQAKTVIELNGEPVASVYNGVKNAGKRIGIDWLTPHLLKHSSCVWMAEGGVPLADIAALTCTSYATIEKHYLSFTPDRGMRAVSALQIDQIA